MDRRVASLLAMTGFAASLRSVPLRLQGPTSTVMARAVRPAAIDAALAGGGGCMDRRVASLLAMTAFAASLRSVPLRLQGSTSTVMARAVRTAAIHGALAGGKAAWTAAALRASQ